MNERISPIHNPFQEIVRASCEGREPIGKNIAVIAIGGTEGSGSTSTGKTIQAVAHRMGIDVKYLSFTEEAEKEEEKEHGRIPRKPHKREPIVDRTIYLNFAREMVSDANKNSLVVVEGILAPYVAKRLERTASELGLELPSEIVKVYLTTRDKDVGYERKYLAELKKNQLIDKEEFFKELDEQRNMDLIAARSAFPEIIGKTPFSFNFSTEGEGVYDLRYDTSAYNEGEITQQILTHPRVASMITALPNRQANGI